MIQWPPLAREGFRYEPRIDLHDEGLRRVLLLMGPGTIGMAATQINVFVNTILATGQGTGAVSWLDYAFRLMYLPIGLFRRVGGDGLDAGDLANGGAAGDGPRAVDDRPRHLTDDAAERAGHARA